MFPDVPEEQVRRAVEAVAAETLAEAGVDAPPVDAFAVARRLGIVVARDRLAATRARFVRLGGDEPDGQPTILLADDPRPERRHWSIAHEVGECQAYRVFAELGVASVDVPADAREQVANRLAGCLLLPRRWFGADGRAVDWDLVDLKQRYATASHELIARRMLDMPPRVIVTLCDQGRPVWRKSNLPGHPSRLAPPEQAAWRTAHERGVAARCERSELPDGVEDVRAWAIHEPGWRREILRTQLAEEL